MEATHDEAPADSTAPQSSGAPVAYAWLSVATAVGTLALKSVAAWLTGSVGLLSDAIESIVNLVAALGAVFALRVAARPADDDHPHGHDKVEYFSSGFEGALILAAAVMIAVEALPRFVSPRPLESLGVGLGVSVVASLANFVVARLLFRAAKKHRSITLEADAHHLMSDVWTSVGVLIAVGLVKVTGYAILDPLAAVLVAANIVRIAVSLVQRSIRGLLDEAVPADERARIDATLARLTLDHAVEFHALRTRQSASRKFVELHVLVPGAWSVQRGHDLCEVVERELRDVLGTKTTVMTHLEPIEDPVSFADQDLDRVDGSAEPGR